MFKLLITIVVIAAIAGGLWYTGWLSKILPMIPMMHSQAPAPEQAATTTSQTPVAQAPAPVNDLPTAANDASDQALVQDTAAIDAQMQGLGSDNTSSSGSLNDKPVSQEY